LVGEAGVRVGAGAHCTGLLLRLTSPTGPASVKAAVPPVAVASETLPSASKAIAVLRREACVVVNSDTAGVEHAAAPSATAAAKPRRPREELRNGSMAGHLWLWVVDKGASMVRLDAGRERLLAAVSEGIVVRILPVSVRLFKVARTPRSRSHRAHVSEDARAAEDQIRAIVDHCHWAS
jgi:hypothetical protein